MSNIKQLQQDMENGVSICRATFKELVDYADRLEQVRMILMNMQKDADKCRYKPIFAYGIWRGKDAFLAGYEWSRIGSGNASGRVYETILGHGATPDEAIEMMAAKIHLGKI